MMAQHEAESTITLKKGPSLEARPHEVPAPSNPKPKPLQPFEAFTYARAIMYLQYDIPQIDPQCNWQSK